MPQLNTGRHVGVMAHTLIDHVTQGTDASVYAFIVAYRLSVQEAAHLRNLLPVVYFKEVQGIPPNAPAYSSGFLVQDVLAGKAGWLLSEVDEFKTWLESNEPLNNWLTENFAAINQAIQSSIIWQSEFVTNEPESGARH